MRLYANIAMATTVGVITSLSLNPIHPGASAFNQQQTNQTYQTEQSADTSSSNQTHHETKPKAKKVTVQPGDSLTLLAKKNHTSWVRLFNANKGVSDPNMIYPGQKLTVPLKDKKLPNRYQRLTQAQISTMPTISASDVQYASQPAVATHGHGGGANKYMQGTCTWYVKNMRPDIGGMWGNASSYWLTEARAAGFSTGSSPAPGAVAVEAGHVAIVNHPVGKNRVSISEMNYGGGVGVVHTRTVPASTFQYIY